MTCERCMGTGRIIGEAREPDADGYVALFNIGCTDCRGTGWKEATND